MESKTAAESATVKNEIHEQKGPGQAPMSMESEKTGPGPSKNEKAETTAKTVGLHGGGKFF